MHRSVLVALLLRSVSARRGSLPPLRSLTALRGGAAVAGPEAAVVARARGGGDDGLLGGIVAQVASEVKGSAVSPAKRYGFYGATCNWFLGLSAVSDALGSGPELISLQMTLTLLAYSAMFGRWAAWDVSPPNYVLAGSHAFNLAAQSNQLRRCLAHRLASGAMGAAELRALGAATAASLGAVSLFARAAPGLRARAPRGSYLASDAGPFTIHPWPPLTKLAISLASLADLWRPTDAISLSQYAALSVTAAIFSKYALLVAPVNIPLCAVNVLLFFSSFWHLSRKVAADFL